MDKSKKKLPIEVILCKEINQSDDINLVTILKTLYSHKLFITIFTIFTLLLAWLYLRFTKPIYKVESFYELGYYFNKEQQQKYFLNLNDLKYLVKYKFDKKDVQKLSYPQVNIKKLNKASNLLDIEIKDYTNKKAISVLEEIVKFIKTKEQEQSKIYKNLAYSQITTLQNYIKKYKNSIKSLTTNSNILNKKYLNSTYEEMILKSQILKNQYNNILLSIHYIKPIDEIKKSNEPIAPKYILFYTLVFISSVLFTTFIIFFRELIIGLKEEERNCKQ